MSAACSCGAPSAPGGCVCDDCYERENPLIPWSVRRAAHRRWHEEDLARAYCPERIHAAPKDPIVAACRGCGASSRCACWSPGVRAIHDRKAAAVAIRAILRDAGIEVIG